MQLSTTQLNTLTDVLNVGARNGIRVLNLLLSSPVSLSVPMVRVMSIDEANCVEGGSESAVAVDLRFKGPWRGVASLVFTSASAAALVDVLTEEDHGDEDFDSWRRGTLTEVGNIVLGGVMSAIGDLLEQRIDYELPVCRRGGVPSHRRQESEDEGVALLFEARFALSDLSISGNVAVLFHLGSQELFGSALERLWGATA